MPNTIQSKRFVIAVAFIAGTACGAGLIALAGHTAIAAAPAPTEHKGLAIEVLGVIDAESMKATLGLEGQKMQLRAITIAPGGQIAKHSHEKRPGLVKVIDGEWIEGQASGEAAYSAADKTAILEDVETTHWFFNHGDKPATALVCDIVPDK
jgi:quercetin dioxygenase-like cupin family protein